MDGKDPTVSLRNIQHEKPFAFVTADVEVKKMLENRHVTSPGGQVSWSVDQSGRHVMISGGVEELFQFCSMYMTDEIGNRHFC